MKKFMVLGAVMCVALAFTGCKSSESAYKKAYEKQSLRSRILQIMKTIQLSKML